eukprot:TRINITY_DN13152_c0_g1_i1.p1 TRINITY_DN13152_c0_g1~~TRINITY_DN13152_c0_g1_i1.p1  ORF type:complete len:391 (-),score=18.17 TRINITY_DN13152_c0_g1_i1:51-1223(-)
MQTTIPRCGPLAVLRAVRTDSTSPWPLPFIVDTAFLRVASLLAMHSLPDSLAWRVAVNLCWDPLPSEALTVLHCKHGDDGDDEGLDQVDPVDIFATHDGSVFLCDAANHCVYRWEGYCGQREVAAGCGTPGVNLSQLQRPHGIFVFEHCATSEMADNSVFELFVADTLNSRVVLWPARGTQGSVVAGGHGHGTGLHQLCMPNAVLVCPGSPQRIFISDSGNNRIVCWNAGDRSCTAFWHCDGRPTGVATTRTGRDLLALVSGRGLLVWRSLKGAVVHHPAAVVALSSYDTGGMAILDTVACETSVLCDTGANRVVITRHPMEEGEDWQVGDVVAGSLEGQSGEDAFLLDRPSSVAVVPVRTGLLLIVDRGNRRVQMVSLAKRQVEPAGVS